MIGLLIFGCIWFIGLICYLIVFSKMLNTKQKYYQALNDLCQSFERFNKDLKKLNKEMDEILINAEIEEV